ncbi:hypothetical protein CesoFtcFv8_022542 [Champsocephalus esox]|uniref:Uncharacterized protein n=2 Tax=Champsocephalus TaxID=52236 RepID=A0AAN8CQU3_CHAGU|nr:hypothetical protein CesoFtcFv8_022542 [Champsocephalus esox]KAK5906483.1 hypothetical protein CgunFtcFv8_002346 [Champsocephalus gunnari]
MAPQECHLPHAAIMIGWTACVLSSNRAKGRLWSAVPLTLWLFHWSINPSEREESHNDGTHASGSACCAGHLAEAIA